MKNKIAALLTLLVLVCYTVLAHTGILIDMAEANMPADVQLKTYETLLVEFSETTGLEVDFDRAYAIFREDNLNEFNKFANVELHVSLSKYGNFFAGVASCAGAERITEFLGRKGYYPNPGVCGGGGGSDADAGASS